MLFEIILMFECFYVAIKRRTNGDKNLKSRKNCLKIMLRSIRKETFGALKPVSGEHVRSINFKTKRGVNLILKASSLNV